MTHHAEVDLSTLTLELLSGHWTVTTEFVEGAHRCYTANRVRPSEAQRRPLSRSEREVLLRALRGESNKQIAYELGVGPSGVSTLLSRARKKLGRRVPEELLSGLVGAIATARYAKASFAAASFRPRGSVAQGEGANGRMFFRSSSLNLSCAPTK